MAQATMKLTTSFADSDTRVVELGPFDPNSDAITNAKTNIATFNTNVGSLSGLYISDGGANCTGITAAEIIVKNETVYNLND